MNERVLGYVRVSTKEQNLDRQLIAMREFGVPEKQIYQDKLSGKDFDRPAYQKLMKAIKPGDTLVIKSIDRLDHKREERRDRSTGHAAAGHAAEPRFDRDADRGYRSAAFKLRRTDGARIHPPAAAGRDRGREGARHAYGAPGKRKARQFRFRHDTVARGESVGSKNGGAIGCIRKDIQKVERGRE